MAVAIKTLRAIDAALLADMGNTFKANQRHTLPACEDAYKAEDGIRSHLGASLIGRECARELWYSFRWFSSKSQPSAHMLRLWNRGHLEEGRFIALLQMIGVTIYQHDHATGKQFRISDHGGHFGGSSDGVAIGLPDFEPNTPVLTEFKTHNEKSFKDLVTKGVREAKWEHYVQMQVYMAKLSLSWGCYFAVCKNDDTLHAEMIAYDDMTAQRYVARAGVIIKSNTPPPKINQSPSWFKCRFCDQRRVCHFNEKPQVNCRTCFFGQPVDGGWRCNFHNVPLDRAQQLAACGNHRYDDLWNFDTTKTTR